MEYCDQTDRILSSPAYRKCEIRLTESHDDMRFFLPRQCSCFATGLHFRDIVYHLAPVCLCHHGYYHHEYYHTGLPVTEPEFGITESDQAAACSEFGSSLWYLPEFVLVHHLHLVPARPPP